MPIASIMRPRALRRTSTATPIVISTASRNTTGSPTRYPFASQRNGSLDAAVFWPAVMTFARPRPASMITSVLMKGCSPTTETSMPLTAPRIPAMRSARPIAPSATPSESEPAAFRNSIETAPATTMIEPPLRSMPPVATTRHMPTAISITGAAARRMSTRLPTRFPVSGITDSAR